MMVGNIFRVQGLVANMVIYPEIATKYPKNQKKWGMVLIVGDDVEECLQGPGSISKYGNLSKHSQILTKKSEKHIKWYGMSGTAFRVHFRVYPKKEISSGLTKK